jgi:hypothetical protein
MRGMLLASIVTCLVLLTFHNQVLADQITHNYDDMGRLTSILSDDRIFLLK